MKKLTQKQNKEACQFFLKLATALGLVTVFGLIVTQNKGKLNIKNVKKPSLPSIGSPLICPSCNEPTNGDNIPDDPPATPIVGQSGTIIDLNGLPGSGKSPFALTLTSEACDGAPYGLLSDNSGKPLPPFKCIWYHTERDIKFKAHYGEKLTQLGERIKLFKECRFSNMDAFIKSLEGSIAKANDNCCIIIDTPSSLLNTDELKLNGVRRFINELKRVRAHSNKQGHTITFIIVTHKTPSSGGVRGSSVWYEDSETFIDMSVNKDDPSGTTNIMHIKKRKDGPQETVLLRRVLSPYMHFERADASNPQVTTVVSDIPDTKGNADTRKPVDTEAETIFHNEYPQKSYNEIFNQYKDEYQLKNRDTVRNAIQRAENRIIDNLPELDIYNICFQHNFQQMTEDEILEYIVSHYNIRTKQGLGKVLQKGSELVSENV